MRAWAGIAAVALLLLAVPAQAQQPVAVAPGGRHEAPVDVEAGAAYILEVTADAPLDVLLVEGDAGGIGDPAVQPLVRELNVTTAAAQGTFPSAGRWTLVLDNSASPADGANGTRPVNATLRFAVTPPQAPADDGQPRAAEGSRNPWPVLMLTSPYWDLGAVGLGGMALWFLLLGALAAARYREGWAKVAVLGAGVAGLVALWWLLPAKGPMAGVLLPLLFAAGIAWVADRSSVDARQGLRMAFLAGGLGAIVGVLLGQVVAFLWDGTSLLLVGADRFDDPVFVVSVAGGLGAILIGVFRALAEADVDEEPEPAAPGPGLGATFTVTCVRCGTPIKVDRSMKRYRVATDRFEFACPNCHAWMEWAEPKPEGAAAA